MFARLSRSRVSRNFLYTFTSQLTLAVLQGLQFLVIARMLGPHEFGRVASVVAFTSALLPFSGLGLGNVAILRLARGQADPAVCLGNGFLVASLTGTVAIAIALLAGEAFLNEPGIWVLIVVFGCSEILLTKYIDIAAHVFYGLERHEFAAAFYNLHMLVRLVFAVGMYLVSSSPSAGQWAVLHLLAGLLTFSIVFVSTVRRVGAPQVQTAQAWRDARQGVYFSITLSARSLYTDIDKAVLAKFVSPATAGAYTAAYRLMHMAYTPVIAALLAVQARMFRTGAASGLRGTRAFVAQMCLLGVAYCIGLAFFLYGVAPLLPWLLGSGYALSSEVMRSLCLLPIPMMLQGVYSQALAGADAQKIVAGLHTTAAAVAIALNVTLVPLLSWHGAVYAAYATQLVLALAVVAASEGVRRRELAADARVRSA